MQATLSKRQQNASRLVELDIAKGMLVVIMIVYHAASIAIASQPELAPFMAATSFLHYVFLFITGFLCGWLYVPRFQSGRDGEDVRARIRAFKIFAVFVVLNLCLYSVGFSDISDLRRAYPTFGDVLRIAFEGVPGRLFSFEILYYIAAFLLLASVLIRLSRAKVFNLICFALILGLIAASTLSTFIFFMAFGFLGLTLGFHAKAGTFDGLARKMDTHWYVVVAGLILQIIFYDQIYAFITQYVPSGRFVFYVIDCFLWLAGLVFLTVRLNWQALNSVIIKLGSYTLLGYILQMLIIHIVFLVLMSIGVESYAYYGLNLLVSFVVLSIIIYVVDAIRKKSGPLDRLYRLVFA